MTMTQQMERDILSNDLLSEEDRQAALADLRKGMKEPQVLEGFPAEGSLNIGEYRTLYHRHTGTIVEVVPAMYSSMLEWTHGSKHPLAGQPVYSIHPIQGKEPRLGTIKCLLHPEHPRRADLEEWGMPECGVGTFVNPAELIRHMRAFHPRQWEEVQEYFPELAQFRKAVPPSESGGSLE